MIKRTFGLTVIPNRLALADRENHELGLEVAEHTNRYARTYAMNLTWINRLSCPWRRQEMFRPIAAGIGATMNLTIDADDESH